MSEADRRPRDGAVVLILIAALIYVGAWIVGLLVAPSAPSESAADQKVQAFFVAHHGSTLVQALLVHGVAGLAFFVFVISFAKLMPAPGSGAMRTVFLVAGMAAVIVSLVQVGLEIGLNRHVASGGGASTTASLFHAVNVADTIKLALLGIAIAAAARVSSETGLFRALACPAGLRVAPDTHHRWACFCDPFRRPERRAGSVFGAAVGVGRRSRHRHGETTETRPSHVAWAQVVAALHRRAPGAEPVCQ